MINAGTRQTGLPVILRNNILGLPHIRQHDDDDDDDDDDGDGDGDEEKVFKTM